MNRNELNERVIAFAEARSGKWDRYAFAYGYVSAMLNEEQLKTLDRYMTEAGF